MLSDKSVLVPDAAAAAAAAASADPPVAQLAAEEAAVDAVAEEVAPLAAEEAAVDAVDAVAAPETVACIYCGLDTMAIPANCVSKKRKEWRCRACHVSHIQLWREGNEMPDFCNMSQDEVHNFWQRANELKSSAEVLHLYKLSSQKKVSSETETFAESGTFLPLSVWSNQGFNAELIAERTLPENVREDQVLVVNFIWMLILEIKCDINVDDENKFHAI